MLSDTPKNSTAHRRLFVLYAIFLLALVIAANSGVLPVDVIHQVPYGDKLGHFLLMGGLSFLAHLALSSRGSWRGQRVTLTLISLVALEELSQLGFSQRRFELADLIADIAGILVFARLATCFVAWNSAAPNYDEPEGDAKSPHNLSNSPR